MDRPEILRNQMESYRCDRGPAEPRADERAPAAVPPSRPLGPCDHTESWPWCSRTPLGGGRLLPFFFGDSKSARRGDTIKEIKQNVYVWGAKMIFWGSAITLILRLASGRQNMSVVESSRASVCACVLIRQRHCCSRIIASEKGLWRVAEAEFGSETSPTYSLGQTLLVPSVGSGDLQVTRG